jgi:integrase
MASIKKTDNGYRVQIFMRLPNRPTPVRESKVFKTRRDAVEWAAERERTLREASESDPRLGYTLRKAIRRYADEVSPTKRGERWEQVRLSAFEGYKLPLDAPLIEITAQNIADFRDSRSLSISSASVRREISLLSSVFQMAMLEWGWVDSNPCRMIRKPVNSKHRERVLQWWEIKRMLREMGYKKHGRVASTGQAVAICMMTALRTGMRAGELTGMRWTQVYERHCHLPTTKTGRPRDVPLSLKACALLERMRGWDDVLVFGVKAASLDALFRKYRQRADLEGFTWHDTRHTAATMISKKVEVLDLCKIFGWADPKMAMVYYNPHAQSLAELLD